MKLRYLLTLPIKLAVVGIFGATLLGFLGWWWWIFDLLANFRAQYVLLLLPLLLIVVVLRLGNWLRVTVIALALNLLFIAPLYTPMLVNQIGPQAGTATSTDDTKTSFRLVFSNLNINNTDAERISDFIKDANPDILLLAEIDPLVFKKLVKNFPELDTSHFESGDGAFGIAVFSKLPAIQAVQVKNYGNTGLPSLEFTASVGEADQFTLIGTHPYPPMSAELMDIRNRQLRHLAQKARSIDHSVIIAGDFNTTPYSPLFGEIVKTAQVKDTRVGYGIQASWKSFSPIWMRIPIDHVLVSEDFTVTNRELGRDIGSDHLPVIVDLEI
jgi:endonuclease/exonuclease/phosphatase (EEP) superfamily protein YafD